MLTIFTIPKAFVGHTGVIQGSAIRSWMLLRPSPEVILFGDDAGTREFARSLGILHVQGIATTEYGTPVLSDVFERARRQARNSVLCYVNADIILTQELMDCLRLVSARYDRFLLVGRRWNLRKEEPIDFTPGWRERLEGEVRACGRPGAMACLDYFVFPRNLYDRIPPFAIGRLSWDNWMVWAARRAGAPVVDVSAMFRAIHLDHDYSHVPGGEHGLWDAPEARRNYDLARGWAQLYTLDHATHRIDPARGVRRNLSLRVARAYAATLKKHAVDVTRPVRHKLGLRQRPRLARGE